LGHPVNEYMTSYLVYRTVARLCNYWLWHQQWYSHTPRFVWLFAFIVALLSSLQRSTVIGLLQFSGPCGVGYSLPEWIARTKAFYVWGHLSDIWC